MNKTITVRVPAEQAEELEAVAQTDEVPVSEVVREAIRRHIAERRADKGFQARLHDSIRRNQAILEKLANR